MWAIIMGADGTGKSVIADILEKRNFSKIEHRMEGEGEFAYLTKRLSEQLEAQTLMHKKDVYTVRSMWDTYEVLFPVGHEMFRVDEQGLKYGEIFYKNIAHNEDIQPPHCVIHTKMTQRDIQNRILLKGREPNDDEIVRQIELYEQFLSKVRVPVLEIDMSKDPIHIRDELNFSIDSMKATSLSSQTIWKKKFFF